MDIPPSPGETRDVSHYCNVDKLGHCACLLPPGTYRVSVRFKALDHNVQDKIIQAHAGDVFVDDLRFGAGTIQERPKSRKKMRPTGSHLPQIEYDASLQKKS